MNKLDEFREKQTERKLKRKEKREKFKEEHPKMADFLLKAELTLGVLAIFSVPYFAGRSSKFEEVKENARMEGYLGASNEFLNEFSREELDYIDDEGKYHQDLKFGAYAVWPDAETYLNAEKQRIDALKDQRYPR